MLWAAGAGVRGASQPPAGRRFEMMQSNELVTLILGLGALGLMLARRSGLRELPSSRLLVHAFYLNVTTWAFTVLEGFVWGDLFNLLEHGASTLSAALLAVWCFRIPGGPGRPPR